MSTSETTPLISDHPNYATADTQNTVDAEVAPSSVDGSEANESAQNAVDYEYKPTGNTLKLILASLFLVIFLSALDATIVATIYAKIGSEFHKSNEVSWIATSYMLTTTAFQPILIGAPLGGLLADTVGWRWAFWINLPLGILPVIMITCFLTDYNIQKDVSTMQKLKQIDYLGTGNYQLFTRLSVVAMVAAEILILLRWNIHTGEGEYLPYLVVDGFGFGSVLTTTLVAMLAAVSQRDMAVGSAMTYLFRSTGAVLGVSMSQAALQSVLKTELYRRFTGPDAERIVEIARKSAADLRVRLDPDIVPIVVDAYIQAIRAGFAVCVACAGVALGASFLLGRHVLRS
ncbi:hypothetical protein HDU67_006505 [Dinochytrium kinnereticum]|nr:hypothetical protein HDU67_006505 [Dinochytrium kinnereticum]